MSKLQTYTVVDMAKVMLRVTDLTRENNRLKKELSEAATRIEELEWETADQLRQLVDYQGYYARQRTAPVTVPLRKI
jgi:hypothetical protein